MNHNQEKIKSNSNSNQRDVFMNGSEDAYIPDEADLEDLEDAGVLQEDDNDEEFEDEEIYDDEEEESEGFGSLA